ncbi:MAG: endonuclease [Frankiales bacterium]|nr:endonuclease [Frankiales bacterium]
MAELEAEDARLYARRMVLRAQMDDLWNASVASQQEQFGVLELAGTARIGQTRASSQLINGTRMVEDLPGILAALKSGVMYRETAVLVLELTRNCSSAVRREVERRLLPTILTANTTDVRRLVLALIPEVEADLEPELTEQRLEQAQSQRQVWLNDRGDGMTGITGEIDAVSAKRWVLDFEELVRAQKIADDRGGVVRTAAQRRADVFAQLPSRFLALLHAVRKGQSDQLLALSLAEPDLADDLEALAAVLPEELSAVTVVEETSNPETAALDELELGALAGGPAVQGQLAQQVPLPPEPPPDWCRDPDPPGSPMLWTDLSLLELASTVMGLPVKNPLILYVHVPMSTALDVDNRSGRIDQGGALPATRVRRLLPDAALRRVLVDPDSGVPLGIDPTLIAPPGPAAAKTASSVTGPAHRDRLAALLTPFELHEQAEPRHDPSRRLGEIVDLRDQTCTGIGCSRPARLCHLDHEIAYPHGVTAEWNLSAKSSRCHRAKHAGWIVTRHGPGPQHGDSTWTSPLGHSYTRLGPWKRLWDVSDGLRVEIELAAHAA